MSIKALYEIKRQNFLIGYIQNPDRFDDALAYAYMNRIAPVFHEDIMREAHEEDPFEDAYPVSAEFVNRVLKYINDLWLEKNFNELGFYNLEPHFCGCQDRMGLIHVLEYTRIYGRFDDALYESVEANAPMEAKPIASSFSPSEVYFR